MISFNTKYGIITLYQNERYIGEQFKNKEYWNIDTLLKLQKYIDPNCNILEIGGHCGTSSIIYASFLNNKNKVYVYEPQRNMYNLLVKNINQNDLQTKIIPYNLGVFCFEGNAKMNNIDLDGGGGIVEKRYNEENSLMCNFGGIGLGNDGENITLTTIDNMGELNNIGFIHCHAQGSENFIFSKGIETIRKFRPVILYKNYGSSTNQLYDNVCNSYPDYKEESKFDIKKYCIEKLNYHTFIDKFNGSTDTLLIPNKINPNYEKKIYITYKNIDSLENIKHQWLQLNPEYQIELFDNEKCLHFLQENYGKKYCDIFNYIKDGPIKADFFRACIIYMCGGVYVDADVKPLIPLHTFINDDVDFVTCISYNYLKHNSAYNFNPHFMISKKYNEYLYKSIKIYEEYYDKQKPYGYWEWSICKIFNIDIDFDFNLNTGIYNHNNRKYQFLFEYCVSPYDNQEYNFSNIRSKEGRMLFDSSNNITCKYQGVTVLYNFINKNLLK